MHFCEVVARVYGRLSKPRNTSLNWFMPAFVNSRVGSSPGTTGDEATMVWPFDSKNFRKVERISAAFIPALSGGHAVVSPGRAAGARRGRAEPSIIGGGVAPPRRRRESVQHHRRPRNFHR